MTDPTAASYQEVSKLIEWSNVIGQNKYLKETARMISEGLDYDRSSGHFESDSFLKFLSLVEQGNHFAVELGFELKPYVDGHYAESLDGSLGRSLKIDPQLFLSVLKKYPSLYEVQESLAWLLAPGDSFDEKKKESEEINKRIKALRNVKNSELLFLRDNCLKVLKDLQNGKIQL